MESKRDEKEPKWSFEASIMKRVKKNDEISLGVLDAISRRMCFRIAP